MKSAGEDSQHLKAIFISHEHSDHVAGLQVLASKLKIPVYLTEATYQSWRKQTRDKEGKPAKSNFPDYAGPLTETILLGNLAVWAAAEGGTGKKIEWDAKNLAAKNAPEVAHVIKREYREGYTL